MPRFDELRGTARGGIHVKIGVIIASRKRPHDIANIMSCLAEQSLPPHRIILSVTGEDDLPAPSRYVGGEVVFGEAGLCEQRNRGLDAIANDCDVALFYDDDFIPSRKAVAGVVRLFTRNPSIAGATGLVLKDGVTSGGIPVQVARAIVDDYDKLAPRRITLRPINGTYGCNMAFHMVAVGGTRFDTALVRYGWQEDIDFSARVGRVGAIVATNAFAGVHRGATAGRSPGCAVGYSQIVNPLYLVRKGTMSPTFAVKLMARNFVANHVKAAFAEPHIDRIGRAKGNWRAIFDAIRHSDRPENILNM